MKLNGMPRLEFIGNFCAGVTNVIAMRCGVFAQYGERRVNLLTEERNCTVFGTMEHAQ